MQIRLRKRLGDLLVEEGIITEAQVEQALAAQKAQVESWVMRLLSSDFCLNNRC